MPGIGLDLDWYDPTPEMLTRSQAVRADMGLADDAVLLTMIAELFPRKGPQDALAALARMDDPRVHLAFAGTGPYRDDLVSMAHDFELIERVHFLSHVADVRPLILASRATTLPSYREGLSRSVLAERFTDMVGQPPMQYLALWRMQLASRLLVEGGHVAEVAGAVGYESEAAFSRAFKKLVGQAPATWRRRTVPVAISLRP